MPKLVVTIVVLGLLGVSGCSPLRGLLEPAGRDLRGLVVSVDGTPIEGARVETGPERTSTGADGTFVIKGAQRPAWISVRAVGFLGRTRAIAPGTSGLVRLTPDDGSSVSLHFTGDVMAGRRFYDPNEDGTRAGALLRHPPTLKDHTALLRDIRPLLEDADLTVVNLETPLTETAYYSPLGPRPESFHPTKDFAFSSDPLLARALKEAGVDAVDLGNNHLFDRLDAGVSETIATLDRMGIAHFGAGASEEEAWAPAFLVRKGQTFAFLGCTSILGDEHALSYVAGPGKAGAAACSPERLSQEVAAARLKADVVVAMVHGGFEYDRTPSPRVASLTAAARQAGAVLAVNHHPHVIGGLDWDGASLAALNMGNFLFDQTIWQTFPGYLLNADIRQGALARAYVEPLVVDDYTPRGLVGHGAASVARVAAGANPGPFIMEDGAVEVDVAGQAASIDTGSTVRATAEQGAVRRIPDGRWVAGVTPTGPGSRFGSDILSVGTFEDEDVDAEKNEADFWEKVEGREFGKRLGRENSNGARIRRGRTATDFAYLKPLHRILLAAGSEVTALGRVRLSPGARASLQLSWYPDTRGASQTQLIADLPSTGTEPWLPFRVDAVAPPGTVAVGFFLRLAPPEGPGKGARTADFDDLALVQWAPAETPPSPQFDHLQVHGEAHVTVRTNYLPGGEQWARGVSDGEPLVEVP